MSNICCGMCEINNYICGDLSSCVWRGPFHLAVTAVSVLVTCFFRFRKLRRYTLDLRVLELIISLE